LQKQKIKYLQNEGESNIELTKKQTMLIEKQTILIEKQTILTTKQIELKKIELELANQQKTNKPPINKKMPKKNTKIIKL